MSLVMQPLAGYQVESEAGRAVALSLELDDELVQEGLAREVVRAVQNARKESGLEVTDRIELRLSGDGELLDAVEAHRAYIAAEVLADEVESGGEGEGGSEVEIAGKGLGIRLAPRESPRDGR
jgi:isoleucyl-tRNA synthetase